MTPAILKRLAQILFLVLLQVIVLFFSAWKWDWWNAWVYLGLYMVFLVFNASILLRKHKELVEERAHIGEGTKGWDKIIGGIGAFGGLLILALAGLDERFSWPGTIRLEVQIAAFILLAVTYPIFTWAMVSNRYFATTVRIQKERGHTVQTGGPYRFVRHPGYFSVLCSYVTAPFALGSLWACIPAALLIINMVVRTALEDRVLQNELEGYKEYAARVNFKLIPGIW